MQHFHRGESCGVAGEGAPHVIAVKVLGDLERPKRGDSLRCLSSVRSLVLRRVSAGMFWRQASLEHCARSATLHVRQDLQPHPNLVRGMGAGGVRPQGGRRLPAIEISSVGLELVMVVVRGVRQARVRARRALVCQAGEAAVVVLPDLREGAGKGTRDLGSRWAYTARAGTPERDRERERDRDR